MALSTILSVGLGAAGGALLRWRLGIMLNALFPAIPLGTLVANLIGGFLMGIFMGVIKNHAFIPEAARLAIATGFRRTHNVLNIFSRNGNPSFLSRILLYDFHHYRSRSREHFCNYLGPSICKTFHILGDIMKGILLKFYIHEFQKHQHALLYCLS